MKWDLVKQEVMSTHTNNTLIAGTFDIDTFVKDSNAVNTIKRLELILRTWNFLLSRSFKFLSFLIV
jgi:hypothetical protein